MSSVATCIILVIAAAPGAMCDGVGFTPYEGEQFINETECKTNGGHLLLDTCLLEGKTLLTWREAYSNCTRDGYRLPELANFTYTLAFDRIVGSFKQKVDYRWIGFIQNSSDRRSLSWFHGDAYEPLEFAQLTKAFIADKRFPACGYWRNTAGNSDWYTKQCNTTKPGRYFCMALLREWYEPVPVTSVANEPTAASVSIGAADSNSTPNADEATVQDGHSTPQLRAKGTSSTNLLGAAFLHCKRAVCHLGNTQSCSLDGRTCICRPGFIGIGCQFPLDACKGIQCRLGRCISHGTVAQCQCISGFGGSRCDIASEWSSDLIQVYNYVLQDLGDVWVIGCAGSTLAIYGVLLRDASAESTLKRHHLAALIIEHILVLCFRSPTVLGMNQLACRVSSVVLLYFRTAHSLLLLFHSGHICSIMSELTGVEYRWKRLHLVLGWTLPLILCVPLYALSPDVFSTGFTCMLNWDSLSIRFLLVHFFVALLSAAALEAAHMHSRWQQKLVGGASVDPYDQTARIGRIGTMFVALLAPLSFVSSSYAVSTGGPVSCTIAFKRNVVMGCTITATYVASNPIVWAKVVEVLIRIRVKITFQR